MGSPPDLRQGQGPWSCASVSEYDHNGKVRETAAVNPY